MINKTIFIW